MNKEKEKNKNTDKAEQNFEEFNDSFKTDRRLFAVEIEINLAYCEALFNAGIINRIESDKIKNTLQTIQKRENYDKSYFENFSSDNIHTFVEARLFQLIGDTALKIKTGKSRVEQFSTAFRLWLRSEIEIISESVADLQKCIIKKGLENKDGVLPGFSNLQNQHPILFGHWVLAYFEMFSRDRERLDEVWRRTNVLPLGAGNLAGTSFEIDYEEIAQDLGFEGIISNSLDAVSDSDFAIEFVNSGALIMLHLGRLSEDLILYSTEKFGFISFGEMNQNQSNKFTDALRIIRAKTGKILGDQMAIQVNLKALPMSYNKDLQENLETVFDSADRLKNCLKIATKVFSKVNLNKEKTRMAASKGFFEEGEVIDYLIQRGVSFGTARAKLEKIQSFAKSNGKKLNELSLEEFQNFSADFDKDIFETLSFKTALENKNQIGGTSPERVLEALEKARDNLARE